MDLTAVLASGVPYFGHEMAARQGAPRRHAYMQAAVKLLAAEGVRSPLILEIGSWAGGSAVTWGRALQRYCAGGSVVCIDAWQPYFDLGKNSEDVYRAMDEAARNGGILKLFMHNVRVSGLGRTVIPLRGRAREVLGLLPDGWFDLAFIDGSHAYADVLTDIRESMRVVAEGGIVCGDDLELQLSQCPEDYARRTALEDRDTVPHPENGNWFHPGVTLAVAEVFGEVSCWQGFWGVRKKGSGGASFTLPEPEPGVPNHLA